MSHTVGHSVPKTGLARAKGMKENQCSIICPLWTRAMHINYNTVGFYRHSGPLTRIVSAFYHHAIKKRNKASCLTFEASVVVSMKRISNIQENIKSYMFLFKRRWEIFNEKFNNWLVVEIANLLFFAEIYQGCCPLSQCRGDKGEDRSSGQRVYCFVFVSAAVKHHSCHRPMHTNFCTYSNVKSSHTLTLRV